MQTYKKMETTEEIKVYIKFRDGKTRCICMQSRKGCQSKNCLQETVTRDKFREIYECFRQNRFGK